MSTEKRTSGTKERVNSSRALFLRQHGVITLDQARSLGFTNSAVQRRVSSGEWAAVYRGIYRSASFPITHLQTIKATSLRLGDAAVASHRCAGYLLKLDGFEKPAIEFCVAAAEAPRTGATIHRVQSIPKCDITTISSIPTTNASRLLVDVGAVVDEETLELALKDAYRKGLTSRPRLKWRIEELCCRGRPGCSAIKKLMGELGSGPTTGSGLEVRLARLIKRSDLHAPERQYEISDGRFVARPDFVYAEQKVAVEADGHRWHTSRAAWERDLRRRNELQRLGWIVIHVTRKDVDTRPEGVIEDIRNVLRLRGHPKVI